MITHEVVEQDKTEQLSQILRMALTDGKIGQFIQLAKS